MSRHDAELERAFDGQAARFERAPVQSDPEALERLVRFARLEPGTSLIDAGCGPGLVAEAFLEAGCRVEGVDLSSRMVERARARCERFGERARFVQGSIHGAEAGGGYGAAVSRYVLHHVEDAAGLVSRQVSLLRPGGVLVLSDHVTDPDPVCAAWHQEIERLRDGTHTRNLTTGGILDLLAGAGLVELECVEEGFTLDFDEWFDRGTPKAAKAEVRGKLLEGPGARGFAPSRRGDGTISIACVRVLARGINAAGWSR